MKKVILCVLISLTSFIFAQNYNNKNGTVLRSEKQGSDIVTVIKHEQNVLIGTMQQEKFRSLFQDKNINSPVLIEDLLGKNIAISEIHIIQSVNSEQTWFKAQYGKQTGYIFFNEKNPYENENWEIQDTFSSSGKTWTVRKIDGTVTVVERLFVRDKPGTENTKKLYLVNSKNQPSTDFDILSMTEETETIDGLTDHWLKIEYSEAKYGWIFGGYALVERGGPKYLIPEDFISFVLGNQ